MATKAIIFIQHPATLEITAPGGGQRDKHIAETYDEYPVFTSVHSFPSLYLSLPIQP